MFKTILAAIYVGIAAVRSAFAIKKIVEGVGDVAKIVSGYYKDPETTIERVRQDLYG